MASPARARTPPSHSNGDIRRVKVVQEPGASRQPLTRLAHCFDLALVICHFQQVDPEQQLGGPIAVSVAVDEPWPEMSEINRDR